MIWSEVDWELRARSVMAKGYLVARGVLGDGWGFITPEGLRRWGYTDEFAATDGAFRHLAGAGRELVRHKKGGIYLVLGVARLVEGGEVMIYEHLAPHERGSWVRDLAEFREPGRFERIEP